MSSSMKGRFNRFSRRNCDDVTAEMFNSRYVCGRNVEINHGKPTPINYKGGFIRRERFSANVLAKDLLEIGVNEDGTALMFGWRQLATRPNDIVKYKGHVVDADVWDYRDNANNSGGTWFTVYDDKMVTMSKGIYENRGNDKLMQAWATMIGVMFVRELEDRIGPMSMIDLIHLWAISDTEDVFRYTIDIKYLGHAMNAVNPYELSQDEFRDIINGVVRNGCRWLSGVVGGNITRREGAYHMSRNMVPGPVSFVSDQDHQLVMWDCEDRDETIELASQTIDLDRYVVGRHHKGDNHSVLFKKLCVRVAKERYGMGMRTMQRDFDDLSGVREFTELTICGLELLRELCAMFRKLAFKKDKLEMPLQLAEQVPMVSQYPIFEKEVVQTSFGKLLASIYATFIKMGTITEGQNNMIEQAMKWGRRYRGSDDYGIYIMLANNGIGFLSQWPNQEIVERLDQIHPIFINLI